MGVHERRARAAQEALSDIGASAAVLTPGKNQLYVSGFAVEPSERHLLLILPASGDPIFFAPALYGEELRRETWVETVHLWDDDDDPVGVLSALTTDLDLAGERILLDDRMWSRFVKDLQTAFDFEEWGLASEVFDRLRMCKDEHEREALRRAASLADAVCAEVRSMGDRVIGWSEQELADHIEERLLSTTGEEIAFQTIVGAGPNGAMPHHTTSERTIQSGDPVVLDFGARVDGYPGDQTRTIVFDGSPPAEFKHVHEVVEAAQQAGVEAVEPGVSAQEIDRAARSVIEQAGYGDEFFHRTGHGIGLDVHEPPYIVEGNDVTLEEGMVFSVEPGVYLEDRFGVRIEDIVLVTETGHERLNDEPHHWQPTA